MAELVERPGLEAEMSCGDVVTAWADRQPPAPGARHPEIHLSPCSGCRGQWRRVVEIRPRGL